MMQALDKRSATISWCGRSHEQAPTSQLEDSAMAKLTPDEIAAKIKTLTGWQFKDNAISKKFQFKSFMDGIHFIGTVAEIAEKADHHPDMLVNYTRVTFICSTHDQGGVTEKDFALATEIERTFTSNPG
jgi:4a-hydroxytetrahydrobiopterin dehydratase